VQTKISPLASWRHVTKMLPGASLIAMLVGVCYPAIESYKAVRNLQKIEGPLGAGSKDDDAQVSWPL
jgi:hypothetical protein